MIKRCKFCNKEFELKYIGQYYCNKDCQKKNLPILKCKNCGELFQVERYRIKTAKFCSNECKYKYKYDSIKHICKHCGMEKVFYANRWRCRPCDKLYKKKVNNKHYISRKKDKRYCTRCKTEVVIGNTNVCEKCKKICLKCGMEKTFIANRWRCILCDKKYRNITKDNRRKRLVEYRENNIEKTRFWSKNRQHRKRCSDGNHTLDEWNNLKEKYNYTCLCCGRKEPEIKLTEDHVVPLSKGGSNSIDNIQPLCQICNSTKNKKTIDYRNS